MWICVTVYLLFDLCYSVLDGDVLFETLKMPVLHIITIIKIKTVVQKIWNTVASS